MAHPCAGQAKTGQQMAKARYADGGDVDNGIDVRSKDEMSTTVGPYSLGQKMQDERSSMDHAEAARGERFEDWGSRIPGSMKAKNDAYMAKHKR